MSKRSGEAITRVDDLIALFKGGKATDADAADALEALSNPEFLEELHTDLHKGGKPSDEEEEDTGDDKDDSAPSDDDDDDTEDSTSDEGDGDGDEEDDDEEDAPPPARRMGKSIVPEFGEYGDLTKALIEGPGGELLLNVDSILGALIQDNTDMREAFTEFGKALASEISGLQAEVRAQKKANSRIQKSLDDLLENVTVEEVAQPAGETLPDALQKSIQAKLEEYRERVENLEDIASSRPHSPHPTTVRKNIPSGDIGLDKGTAVQIFRKGLDDDKIKPDRFHAGCRALDGHGVDFAEVVGRYYPAGLKEHLAETVG